MWFSVDSRYVDMLEHIAYHLNNCPILDLSYGVKHSQYSDIRDLPS